MQGYKRYTQADPEFLFGRIRNGRRENFLLGIILSFPALMIDQPVLPPPSFLSAFGKFTANNVNDRAYFTEK